MQSPGETLLIDHAAECEVLGALMADNDAIDRVEGLSPSHFGEPVHAALYQMIEADLAAGRIASPVSLKDRVAGLLDGELDARDFLMSLVSAAASPSALQSYAAHLKSLALRRALMALGARAMDEAAAPALEPEAVRRDLETALLGLEEGAASHRLIRLDEARAPALKAIDEAMAGQARVPTGLADLDRMLGGFRPGTLSILGGRPGMGKTALGLCLAHNAARAGAGVLYVSLEMVAADLWTRLAARPAHVDYADALTGQMPGFRRAELGDVRLDAPLMIDDRPSLSTARIAASVRRASRRLKREGAGLKLVVVDHLGLVAPADPREPRHLQLGRITKDLVAMAKEADVAVLALCQLNRSLEGRDNKRPGLSDLRESGQIEEDAHLVGFLHREHVYLEAQCGRFPDEGQRARLAEAEHVAELLIRKNRNGATGTIRLYCDMKRNHFAGLV